MVVTKFLRRDIKKYSKLGLRRKKLLKYRKATGRDSKIRLKMRGHMRNVSIGFRTPKDKRGLIEGLKPVLVHNIKELNEVKEDEIVIIANIGAKKKVEIAKIAQEKKIKLHNLNPSKFLKTVEAKIKKVKEKKKQVEVKKEKNKKESEKKAKEKEEAEKKEEKGSGDKELSKGQEDNQEKAVVDKEEKKESKDDKKTETKIKETKPKENKKAGLSNNYGRGK